MQTTDDEPLTDEAAAGEYFKDLDFLVELDEADLCISEEGHPDEVTIPDTKSQNQPLQQPATKPSRPPIQPPPPPHGRSYSGPPPRQPQTPNNVGRTGPSGVVEHSNGALNSAQNARSQSASVARPASHNQGPGCASHLPSAQARDLSSGGQRPPQNFVPQQIPQQHQYPPAQQPPSGEIGFFSAKGVVNAPEGKDPDTMITANAPRFDPKHESPSIRKTPGIDHSSSKPVSRNGTHVPPASSQSNNGTSGHSNGGLTGPGRPGGFVGGFKAPVPKRLHGSNVVNPHMNQARQIGAPGGGASPLANRGQYKPPMKRPMTGDYQGQGQGPGPGPGRPPLNDLSNHPNGNGTVIAGQDIKRVKMS